MIVSYCLELFLRGRVLWLFWNEFCDDFVRPKQKLRTCSKPKKSSSYCSQTKNGSGQPWSANQAPWFWLDLFVQGWQCARSSDFSDSSRRGVLSKFKTFVRTIPWWREDGALSTARRREQINRGRQTRSDYYSIPLWLSYPLPRLYIYL